MNATEALKTVMHDKKVTQERLAKTMGYSAQSCLASRLKGKMSCDLLVELLNQLDYEVVVQPKTSGKRKEGSIVLEPSGLPDGRGKKQKKVGEEE